MPARPAAGAPESCDQRGTPVSASRLRPPAMIRLSDAPLILGHRGSPLRAPENSLRSFALALEEGADGVELDVQRAGDATPVVIHDATLDRTGHGHGPVAALPWRELERLSGAGEPLPSLRQAAAWATAHRAWLNVEIKADAVEEETLAALAGEGALERAILSSFRPAVLSRLLALAPDTPRFLLADAWNDATLAAAEQTGVHGVCLRVDAASRLALDVLRRRDLAVIAWTVDDRDRVLELLRLGVAGVITNRPGLAVEARDGPGARPPGRPGPEIDG